MGRTPDGTGYQGRGLRLTPGVDIIDPKHGHKCGGCKAVVILGRVRDSVGTLKWRNFESDPIEKNGLRYYRRHFCPR